MSVFVDIVNYLAFDVGRWNCGHAATEETLQNDTPISPNKKGRSPSAKTKTFSGTCMIVAL